MNAYTQNLARDLRERPGSQVSAHLLIPGWTTTGDAEHRPGAWLPEQVVGHMADALERDAFFILCPDDETPNEIDHKRIVWNALDIVLDRPALSRWHPDHKDAFAAFMQKPLSRVGLAQLARCSRGGGGWASFACWAASMFWTAAGASGGLK